MAEGERNTREMGKSLSGHAVPVGTSESAMEQQRFVLRHDTIRLNFHSKTLEVQMNEFMAAVTMNPQECQLREKVLFDLYNLLSPIYSNVRLHPFGSLISGLGEKTSDLDVFVDCFGDSMRRGNSLKKSQKEKLFRNVLRVLRGARGRSPMVKQIIPIPNAKVPIIKFVHAETQIHCDVSFENMLSIRNSQLIQFFVDLDPRVRPLTCLIRYWGKFYQLTDSLKIKNYAINLLVLVFLARKNIVPTIYTLQHWKNPSPPLIRIDHWNASFHCHKNSVIHFLHSNNRPPVDPNEFGEPTAFSILKLALEFFQFCQSFPAETHILCTLTGEFIPRDFFLEGNESQLPDTLYDYKEYCRQTESVNEIRRLTIAPHMSWIIQDPFALNFNVGAVTRDIILRRFFRACDTSVTHLSQIIESLSSRKTQKVDTNLMDIFCPVDFDDLPLNKKEMRASLKKEAEKVLSQLESDGLSKVSESKGSSDPSFAQNLVNHVNRALEPNPASQIPEAGVLNFTFPIAKRFLVPLHQVSFSVQPPATFKDGFMEAFTTISDFGKPYIIHKGKVLWVTFMRDFFNAFFIKCFEMIVEIEENELPSTNIIPGLETSTALQIEKESQDEDDLEIIYSTFQSPSSGKPIPVLVNGQAQIDRVNSDCNSDIEIDFDSAHKKTRTRTNIKFDSGSAPQPESRGNALSFPNPFLVEVPLTSPSEPKSSKSPERTPMSSQRAKRSLASPMAEPCSPSSKPPLAKYHKKSTESGRRISQISKTGGIDGGLQEITSGGDKIRLKFESILEDNYKPFLLKIHCSGEKIVWEGRKMALKQIRRENGAFDAGPKNPTLGYIDPMEIENEISKRITGTPAPFKFDCDVSFEPSFKAASIQMEMKEVLFPLRKPNINLQTINTVVTMIQEIHEKYVLFRLHSWLEDLYRLPVVMPMMEPEPSTQPLIPAPEVAQILTCLGRGRGRTRGRPWTGNEQIPPPAVQLF